MAIMIRVFFLILAPLPCSSMAIAARIEMARAAEPAIQNYQQQRDAFKSLYEDRLQRFLSTYRKRHGEPTPAETERLKAIAAETDYQSLVLAALCQEEDPSLMRFHSCLKSRHKPWKQMLGFIAEHLDARRAQISECKARSRMVQVEARFPPYDYLLIKGFDPPAFYDAEAFLSCVENQSSSVAGPDKQNASVNLLSGER